MSEKRAMSAALVLFVVVLLAGAGGFAYVLILALREIMATRERFIRGEWSRR